MTGLERGCVVLDQPQHVYFLEALRLVEDDTPALRLLQHDERA